MVANELFETERDYVVDLEAVLRHYVIPMREQRIMPGLFRFIVAMIRVYNVVFFLFKNAILKLFLDDDLQFVFNNWERLLAIHQEQVLFF